MNATKRCYFKNGPTANEILQVVYNAVFSSATITYCIAVSIAVVWKVRKGTPAAISPESPALSSDPSPKPYSLLSLRSLVCRTCLYPISCFLAYLGANFVMVYAYAFKHAPMPLVYWGRMGFCSRGILHLLAFVADPMIAKALLDMCKGEMSTESDRQKPKFYQIQLASDCDFSYNNLLVSPVSQPQSPCLGKMIKDFQKYV